MASFATRGSDAFMKMITLVAFPPNVRKLKAILAALEFADNLAQVATMPGWKLHPLRGDRKDQYSIAVTGNWQITFRLQGNTVTDVNFEDYH